jgi:hypothetical protein
MGKWSNRLRWDIRLVHWPATSRCAIVSTMTLSTATHAPTRIGRFVGATVVGFLLVDAGLALAYLTIATPAVSALVPGSASGRGSVAIAFGIWSFSLIAGGAFLAAGTNRLASVVASIKRPMGSGGPAARALGGSSDDLAVAGNVIPREGRPVPELVIGSFGVAVIHELPSANRVRTGPAGWEIRSSDGWEPMADPLEAAMRDAERVRRWLAGADLEFVVRVYAALVVSDRMLQRSPTCAVIGASQIEPWIASLPRQRTLTAGRRARLLAMARPTSANRARESRGIW